jgi:hypothetical protein
VVVQLEDRRGLTTHHRKNMSLLRNVRFKVLAVVTMNNAVLGM